ncbi:2-(3-amino-3-carboxypropyl)histidine synthase subunit 2, partial [Linum perenne]
VANQFRKNQNTNSAKQNQSEAALLQRSYIGGFPMDFEGNYEIEATADFIHSRSFCRVALQFPDELLKDSMRVVGALREKLQLLKESVSEQNDGAKEVRLFVMADATYGSCCVDEVGASHIDADCVVHYGHTCLSPTSTVPAFFVLGKASIDAAKCAESLSNYASISGRPILVLYGLEYAHAISHIQDAVAALPASTVSNSTCEYRFADVSCRVTNPPKQCETSEETLMPDSDCNTSGELGDTPGFTGSAGGLVWTLPEGHKMEDYSLFWIGADNSAFANAVLTFNGCEIVRYDVERDCLVTDLSSQRRILKKRYYLVEKAKDANIVGILVGTLGVAGYLNMIRQMKDLITAAGKKVYTFVMGRPNPAKLANFPECDVFVYVSCPQTALLDSKEFLAPVITPFEAMLSFNRGSEWTGAYVTKFWDLIDTSLAADARHDPEEARFSLIQGRYVEDFNPIDNIDDEEEEENGKIVALSTTMEKALQLRDSDTTLINSNGKVARSGAEYYATRTYHGLDMYHDSSSPVEPFLIGRSGKASGYVDESNKTDN